jgi:hypothetical protein
VQRWQYRVVNVGAFFAAGRLVSTLAHLGEEGWELITIYDKSSNWLANMEKGFALFKRPVAEGEEPEGPWADVVSPVDAKAAAAASAVARQLEGESQEEAAGRVRKRMARRQIIAPGAAEALAPRVLGTPLDDVGRVGADGMQGVLAVLGDRAVMWSPNDDAVTDLDLRTVRRVRRSGKCLTVEFNHGYTLVLLLADSRVALTWSDHFHRIGQEAGSPGE